jgi:hypothetical protein
MGSALQNDVKTSHQLIYTYITFIIGFDRGILQSPPLIYALSSVLLGKIPYELAN